MSLKCKISMGLCFLCFLIFDARSDQTTIMKPDGSVTICTVGEGGIVICV